ncbi:MAG: hypothetical protein NZ853_00210 [Leptospiraceae bacterium]|nr:hypothetical protein [Leptospiraceae bacterium]
MNLLQELIEKLSKTFPKEQASQLAEVIYESFQYLLKVNDLNELKELYRQTQFQIQKLTESVNHVSEEQKKSKIETEQALKELTKAVNELTENQKILQAKVDENYIKTQNDINELRQAVKELTENQKILQAKVDNNQNETNELKQAVKELSEAVKQLTENQGKMRVELDELKQTVKELTENHKQLRADVDELKKLYYRLEASQKRLEKQVGGLSETIGGSLEDFALDLVPELLKQHWNMQIESVERRTFDYNGKTYEIDIFIKGKIQDQNYIVLGEAKSNITINEVIRFEKITKRIQKKHKQNFHGYKIRLIFFGFRARPDALDYIKHHNYSMVFTRHIVI